jgi:hypothetical protein
MKTNKQEDEMNSGERTVTVAVIDGEFTLDEIDWGDLSAADVKAGVADLLKHGLLIRYKGGTYERTDKGRGEEGRRAMCRASLKLSSIGERVFTVLVFLDSIRLFAEIKNHAKGAMTEEIAALMEQICDLYYDDMATAADHLRDGKLTIVRQRVH